MYAILLPSFKKLKFLSFLFAFAIHCKLGRQGTTGGKPDDALSQIFRSQ